MKPAAVDADVHPAMFRPTTTPTGPGRHARPGPPHWAGSRAGSGAVDNRRPARRWATLPRRGPGAGRRGSGAPRDGTHGTAADGWWPPSSGCGAFRGVSVRLLELVPPDREAQTSLVLDAGADGDGAARAGGPDGGAAGGAEAGDELALHEQKAEEGGDGAHGELEGGEGDGQAIGLGGAADAAQGGGGGDRGRGEADELDDQEVGGTGGPLDDVVDVGVGRARLLAGVQHADCPAGGAGGHGARWARRRPGRGLGDSGVAGDQARQRRSAAAVTPTRLIQAAWPS